MTDDTGEVAKARDQVTQAVLDIAEEHEFQVWRAVATCLRGAALIGTGQAEARAVGARFGFWVAASGADA